MRRSGNDGVLHQTGRVLPIRDSLAAAVLGAEFGRPARRRVPVVWNGTQPVRQRGRVPTHPDELVLEIRRLKEQCGMMPAAIAAHLAALGIEIDRQAVIRILSYYARGHLVPTEGAPSYLPAKAQ